VDILVVISGAELKRTDAQRGFEHDIGGFFLAANTPFGPAVVTLPQLGSN
jgi:hypothetical protein